MQLTLEKSERGAIDWIGDRYAHGYELWDLLTDCPTVIDEREADEWTSEGPITFDVPANRCRQFCHLITSDGLACFSPSLSDKLREFGRVLLDSRLADLNTELIGLSLYNEMLQ